MQMGIILKKRSNKSEVRSWMGLSTPTRGWSPMHRAIANREFEHVDEGCKEGEEGAPDGPSIHNTSMTADDLKLER